MSLVFMVLKNVLKRKRNIIMPCLGHFFANPPQFVKGEMQYLYDHEGKK